MKNVIGKGRILIQYKNMYRLEIELVNMLSPRLLGKDQRQTNLFLWITKKLLEIFFFLICLVLPRKLGMLYSKQNLRILVFMGNTQLWARPHIWPWVKPKGYFARCLLEIVSRSSWKDYKGEWNGLSCIFKISIQQESGNISLRATLINVTNYMNLWMNWYPVESSFLSCIVGNIK